MELLTNAAAAAELFHDGDERGERGELEELEEPDDAVVLMAAAATPPLQLLKLSSLGVRSTLMEGARCSKDFERWMLKVAVAAGEGDRARRLLPPPPKLVPL